MAATPPPPLWREVKAQFLAGTMIVVATSILGGIGYLIHRVPTQLDRVIENQTQFRGRLEVMERTVDQHGDRIVRLEATK